MDLSIKSKRRENAVQLDINSLNITKKELAESVSSKIFLPSEIPKILILNEDFEQHKNRLDELRSSFISRNSAFSGLRKMISALKEKYPIVPRDQPLLHWDSPENVQLFNSILGIEKPQRKRKPSANVESDTISELSVDVKASSSKEDKEKIPRFLENNQVQIGKNGTCISKAKFERINWKSTAISTRALLMEIFTISILASHTLTGKPSPAFYGRERPPKHRLDAKKVDDIIECVTTMNSSASQREVRAAITTKCADASKKQRYLFEKSERRDTFLQDETSNDILLDVENLSTTSQ